MMTLQPLMEQLQEIMANPWMLTFLVVWVFGWMLKEKTSLNNNLIPWAVIVLAATLCFLIIEQTLNAVLIGIIMGWVQVGFYEQVKGTIQFFGGK